MEGIIKKIKENRIAYGEGIYLLYFAVMAGARSIGLLEGTAPYTVTLVLGMLLLGLKLLLTEHTITEYGVIGACMFVATMVYLHSGEKGLIVCFSMMLGMKAVSKRKVIIVGIVVVSIMITLRVLPVVFGLTDEIYYPQERAGVGLMFRHALGYAHPNTLHMNVLMLSLMIMYLITFQCRRLMIHEALSKKLVIEVVIVCSFLIFGFNVYVFQYSGSRTGLLACFFYMLFNLWLICVGKIRFFEKVVLYSSFPISCFLTIIVPLFFPSNIVDKLNDTVFMGRYWMDRFLWTSNKPVLWGQRLKHEGGHAMTYGLDSAQMYLFLQLGIVAFILMTCLIFCFVLFSVRARELPELSVFETMLLIGLWEPLLYNLSFKNFTYVFMGHLLYEIIDTKGKPLDQHMVGLNKNESIIAAYIANCFVMKKIVLRIFVAMTVGTMAFGLYYSIVQKPSALYGSREESENGGSLDMDALYFTEDQINELRQSGDIVVGYKGEMTPMYRYDKNIAMMEFKKKAISVGVFWCILVLLIYLGYSLQKFNVALRGNCN